MSAPRWDQVPQFDDPLDVVEALLDCAEADATWARLIDSHDDTPACAALRATMAARCRAWEFCAKRIENVALGHLISRHWQLVAQFSDAVKPGAGAAAPIYETAAGWLAAALLRLEETNSRGSAADDEP